MDQNLGEEDREVTGALISFRLLANGCLSHANPDAGQRGNRFQPDCATASTTDWFALEEEVELAPEADIRGRRWLTRQGPAIAVRSDGWRFTWPSYAR